LTACQGSSRTGSPTVAATTAHGGPVAFRALGRAPTSSLVVEPASPRGAAHRAVLLVQSWCDGPAGTLAVVGAGAVEPSFGILRHF
jgi:hypothetical protein